MTQKTITVKHPEAHWAPAGALDEAKAEAGIPEDATVASSTNESGVETKWTFTWDDEVKPTEAEMAAHEAEKYGTPATPKGRAVKAAPQS